MFFIDERTYLQYFKDVSHTRMPVNAEEERLLFERYRATGDTNARDKIVEGGLRFVIKTAKQFYHGDVDFLQTLIAAGNVGLLIAVDRYRPWVIPCPQCNKHNYVPSLKKQRCSDCNRALSRGDAEQYTTRFLTYAAWWISEAIRTELYESSLIHIPPYKQKEYYRERLAGQNVGYKYLTLEDASPMLTRDESDDPINLQARKLIRELLTKMNERHAYVLIAYYGLREEAKTLREIATKLGICSERVRQIKLDAMAELYRLLRRRRIKKCEDVFT